MKIRKNASRVLGLSDSNGQQQVSPPCQPAWSPPTHTAHDATKKGVNLTISERYNIVRSSEEICVLNRATMKEDYCEEYLEHIPRRGVCNCIALNRLEEELKMDDMLEEHTSTKHMLFNKMEEEVFVENKMHEDVKMMKAREGSNNGRERKEKVEETVGAPKTISSSSNSDEGKTLVGSDSAQVSTTSDSVVVTSASVPTISNPRKRRKVACGSGQDYYYYTEFGAFPE